MFSLAAKVLIEDGLLVGYIHIVVRRNFALSHVESLFAEEVFDSTTMISLEFDGTVFDGTATRELRFEIRRERIHVDITWIEPFDDRYLFSVSALVDVDRDFLGLFGDVFTDAEFLGQSTRRADFRHYERKYSMALLNTIDRSAKKRRLVVPLRVFEMRYRRDRSRTR